MTRLKKFITTPATARLFFAALYLVVALFPQAGLAISKKDREAIIYDTTYYEDCGKVGGTPGTAVKKQVYLLGDSLMEGMKGAGIEKSFSDAGWTTLVSARPGRGLFAPQGPDDGFTEIKKHEPFITQAGTIVIELGTNPTENNFGEKVNEFMQELKKINKTATVYWVDIAAITNLAIYSQRNATLYTDSAAKGIKIIPWYRTVFPNGNPLNMTATSSPLIPTDVHPTPEGYTKMKDLIFKTATNETTGQTIQTAGGDCVCKATVSAGELPSSVPEPYRSLFPKAAAQFNADLMLVTVVFYKEHGGSFPPPPPPYGNGPPWRSSPAGASGPFQFIPGTWAGHGQDGNGDGVKDVQDLTDAAYAAAEFLASMGGVKGTPLGSPADPYAEGTLIRVAAAYNFGPGNIEARKPLPPETRDYIDVIFKKYNELSQGGANTTTVSNQNTGCGGAGVSPDGFHFPQKTTKTQIKQGNGQGLRWCYDKQKSCHHSYPAADIANVTGTPVVAGRGGTVTKKRSGGKLGDRLTIIGDDGKWYYYAHMGSGTATVNDNDKVTAGQDIGKVGTGADAEGTSPHLHFDISNGPNNFRRGYGFCEAPCTLIDPQPVLVASFEALPEQ